MKKIVCLMMLLITAFMFNAQSQVILPLFQENFDAGVFPAGWLQIDADADGYMWETAANPASYVDGQLTGYGHNNSAGFMLSGSYSNLTGEAIEPDNWLITPPVELTSEAVLKFWVCAQDPSYAAEHYGVYITTNTDDELTPEDFTLLFEETVDTIGGTSPGAWKQRTADLSDYTGQMVRIAFRHFDCEDQFLLDLDDVEILTESFDPTITVTPTTINFNSVLLGDTSSVRMAVITGFNFTGDITATTDYPFEISLDGEEYGTSVTMDAEGDTLYVRFIPTDQSEVVGLVMLSATGASNAIVLAGKGEDCIIQEEEMPLTQSFETADDLMCWTILRATTDNSISLSTQSTVGTHSLQFSSISSSTDYNQWLITPELPEVSGKVVSFDYKRHSSSYTENFRVGYSTTTNDLTAFTWGPVVEVNEDLNWHTYVNTSIPGEAKYVAINYCANYAYYLYIDNMKVSEATGCMFPTDLAIDDVTGHTAHVSWTPAGSADGTETFYVEYLPQGEEEWLYAFTSESELILEDLLPETHYNVRLYMDCSSETSDTVYGAFTTPEACGNPTNLVVAGTTGTTATLRWTPSPLAEGTGYEYHIEYATEEGDWQSASTTTTGNEYILSGLDQQTAYNVRVFMDCDESGDGYSDTLTATFSTKCLSGGEWEIGDSSTTSAYMPMHTNWKYAYTQQIYLASELNGASEILSIAFNATSLSTNSRNLKIYMMPTEVATNTDWLDASEAQLVYSNAAAPLTNGWNTFTLTTPFQYDGVSNIAVIVVDSTGSYSGSSYWSSHEPTTGLARYYYSDDTFYPVNTIVAAEGYATTYRNDVIFGMPCDEEAQCIAPVITIGEVTSDAITVAWVPGYNETAWTVAYKAEGEEEWTEAVASVSESPYTITGLDPATVYSVRVGSLCADEPVWSAAKTALTECVSVVVTDDEPFSEDFNTLTTGIPLCWDNSEGTTTTTTYKWNYNGNGQTGACVMFNSSYNYPSGSWNVLKTPVLDLSDVTDPQLSFSYMNGSTGDFSVYLSTDGGDTYTTPIVTGLTNHSSWTPVTVSLGELTDADNVVIVFKGTSNYNYSYNIYLDNVVVGPAATCPSPEKNSVTISEIDGHNATVHFVDNDENHTAWTIHYRPIINNVPGDWDVVESEPDTMMAHLTELAPLTKYEVYVTTNCDDVEESVDATYHVYFTTLVACPAPQDVEVTELTTTSATLTWFSNAESFIVIIRENGSNENVEPITIDENEIEFTELTPATTYTVRIIADCGELDSLSAAATFSFTTECDVFTTYPYVETFATTSSTRYCWTAIDANHDNYTFKYSESGYMYYGYNGSNAANDWLISPEFVLNGSQIADFDYWCSSSSWPEKFQVFAIDAEGNDTALTNVITVSTSDHQNLQLDLSAFTGNYKIGIHCISAANMFNLYIDNFRVQSADVAAITVDPTSMAFTGIVNIATSAKAAVINGMALEGEIVATVTTPFEVSADGATFGPTATLEVEEGLTTLNTLFVRYNPTEPGNHEGIVALVSGEAMDTITLTGSAIDLSPVALPYSTDFTEATDQNWYMNNGTLTNHWTLGTVSGHGALFVTNGTTPGYSTGYTTIMAEKLFTMPEVDSVHVEFDLKIGGEKGWDYLKAFLAPANTEFVAGTDHNTYSNRDSSTYAMNFSSCGSQLESNTTGSYSNPYPYAASLSTDTIHVSCNMPVPAGSTTAKFVFLWRNDNSTETQPAAIISNFSIEAVGDTIPTPPVVVLPTVTTNEATNVTQTNATLNGTITNPGNVAITEKGFLWKQNSATTFNTQVVTGDVLTYTCNDLQPSTDYTFKAYVATADTTLYGAELTFHTEGTTPQPPAVPTVATNDANPFDQTTATLHATITNPDNVAITAKGFQVRVTNGGTFAPVEGTGTGNTFTANLTGLTPATGYTFKAFITTADTTVFGDEKTFTTLEEVVEPCDVPTNITFSEITKESMKVSWTANADVTEWKVQYRAQNAETWTNGSTQTNSYLMTGLIPQTTYEVQVQAVCSADNVSAWSEIVTETTLEDGLQSHLAKNVVLYPNPAKEFVTVQCTMDNVQFEIETVEVLDVYGKLISTVDMVENPTRINVSGLANGMYFVRVTTDQGVVTKTFIKK